MIQLLNRIAWIISFIWWILIILLFWGEIETFLIWIILWIIIKWVFLPRNYIEWRVTHFARVALKWKTSWNISSQNKTWNTADTTKNIKHDMFSIQTKSLKDKKIKAKINAKEKSLLNTAEDFIKSFFSENILAKVGWILVLLWVLFLLSLVWKILLGIWILINYVVILSGRYLIGLDTIDKSPIFTAWISFIFLILNTFFAVSTALIYKSSVFLVFSLFFAYLCPFLVWGNSATPYILVGYSLIVSTGTLFLAKKDSNIFLLLIAFFLWNFLIFIAPNFINSETFEMWYMTKYLSLIWLSLVSLLSAIKMNIKERGLIEILFSATFFAVWLFGLIWTVELHTTNYFMSIIAAFVFMFFSYIYMKQWPYLYTIWTIAGGIILLSHLDWADTTFLTYNIISISLYLCLNIAGAFILKIQNDSHLKNLVLWSVSGIFCTGIAVYLYCTQNYETTIFMGVIYLLLSILYGIISYILFQRFWKKIIEEDSYKKNTLYNFLAISIFLLSLAWSLIFSDTHFIVSLFWLLESAILIFFFLKVKDIKVLIAWFILMWLWIIEWFSELWNVNTLVPYIAPSFIMFWTLLFNLTRLKGINIEQLKVTHSILHIFWIIWIIVWITLALHEKSDSTTIASLALFLCILWYIYKVYGNTLLKKWFLFLFILTLFTHMSTYVDNIYWWEINLFNTLFQYSISCISILAWIIHIFSNKNNLNVKQWILTSAIIYLFIMTTLYIYHIFPNTFAITLYWWVLSFLLISKGIHKNIIRLRTVWLYLVILVCAKIVFIDISAWINDAIIKVIAFMWVWIMFIVIGTMYSKKYGNAKTWS